MRAVPLQKEGIRELRKACLELRRRLEAGESARVEEFLSRSPSLAENEDAVLELIHVEVTTRDELGQKLSLGEWQERFPRLLPKLEESSRFQGLCGLEMPTLHDASASGSDASPSLPWTEVKLPKIGNYQILEELGRGGMGVVYKARQPNLSRLVAIKMILAGEHAGLRERSRLRIEAEAAAQIIHPNVVQVFEVGDHNGMPFLVLEYVSGGNLTRMLRGMPQAFRWSARLTEILARAIHVAHERGIVHRDLNPSNILMSADGTPKISDFGLAKTLVDDIGVSINGVPLGTPSYMAPEQVSGGGKEIGPATDTYALGTILYEMLTGAAPFRGLTPMETLFQVMEAELVAPSRLRHGVPEDLETICLKCLDRDPARRYATAEDLADDLKRWQENQPITAIRTSRLRHLRQWARRQPMAAGLLGLSLLLFLTLLLVVGGLNLYISAKNQVLERQISKRQIEEHMRLVQRKSFDQDEGASRERWYGSQLFRVKHFIDRGELDVAGKLFREIEEAPPDEDPRGFEWYYLAGLVNRSVRPIGDPERFSTAMAVGRGGGTLASGDREGLVALWNLADDTSRLCPEWHDGSIQRIAVSPGIGGLPGTLASASETGKGTIDLRLWDPLTCKLLKSFQPDMARIADLRFSPDGALLTLRGSAPAAGPDRSRAWRRGSHGWKEEPAGTAEGVDRLVASPDGRMLAFAGTDGMVRLRATGRGEARPLTGRPGARVVSLAFSRDGRLLAAGRDDKTLTVWEAATGEAAAEFRDHDGPVDFVDFRPDGRTLVGCDRGGLPWTRRAEPSSARRILPGAEHDLDLACLSPDGGLLAAKTSDQSISIWDLESGKELNRYVVSGQSVADIAFTDDGEALIVRRENGPISIWSFRDLPDSYRRLSGHVGKEARTLAFRPDGAILASGGDDHLVRLWDVATGRQLAFLSGHTKTVTSLAFRSSGNQLVSTSLDGTVRIWELPEGKPLAGEIKDYRILLNTGGDGLKALAISHGGRLLAAAGELGRIYPCDLENPDREIRARQGHNGPIHSLAFTEDSVLASASADGMIAIWKDNDPDPGHREEPHDGGLETMAISPHSQWLAEGVHDRGVTLSRLYDPTVRIELTEHPLAVRGIAFSPDSKLVATACDDGNVRLWNVKTGVQFYSLHGHRARVNSVAFSPDGRTLASCDHAGNIHLWDTGEVSPSAPTSAE